MYIEEVVMPSLRDRQDEVLLNKLLEHWKNHKVMVRWLSRFFNYLDRYYIARHNLHSLADVGLLVFRDSVYIEIKDKASAAILSSIEGERKGDLVNTALLRDILGIYQEVGMGTMDAYQLDFEGALLIDTSSFYRRRAAAWIVSDSTPDYLIKSEEALKAEEHRVDAYLHQTTRPKLLQAAETELLAVHQNALLDKEGTGAAALLIDDKKEDLSRMYRMFRRIPKGLEPMADIFKKHVEEEGLKLVRATIEAIEAKKEKEKEGGRAARETGSPEHTFIRSIVSLHDKYSDYVSNCFENASLFHRALKEAFESFANKQVAGASVAELMASFCDNILKKGGAERLSDEDLDDVLDKVIKLLEYVSDKDLFAEFYRKKLARRLLFGVSSSEDAEKAVLTRLKQQCGAQFTSKMEGMVNDLALAKEKEKAFEEWVKMREMSLPVDMGVTVLTTGFWPTYKHLDITLPSEMMACLEAFNTFHDDTNKKMRKLTWQLSMGTVVIKAAYDKPYELIVFPLQAAVLVLFNDQENITYKEISERTQLPDEDLDRVLHSLTFGKYKFLQKRPGGKSIGKEDSFSCNSKFTDRQRRLRVPLPTVDDRRKVTEDVDKERKYTIDAAIVRVMKSRKTLMHQNLIAEVVQQLRRMFEPDIRVIKRCVEGLIERDYLERDQSQNQLYKYVA